MLIMVQNARSADRHQMHKLKMDAGQVEPGHKSTTCPQRGDLPQKERKEAKCSKLWRRWSQKKTPAASLGLYSMLKMLAKCNLRVTSFRFSVFVLCG
ncbi:hypothetical protein ACQJBY_012274 [Aegilops geniculata]